MAKRGASKQVTDSKQSARQSNAPRTSRIERFFARLGLAVLALFVLAGVLVVDAALAPPPNQSTEDTFPQTWDMHLVTSGGREIGGTPLSYTLALSPVLHYENYRGAADKKVSLNSLGCRGPEPDLGRETCAILGGSTTFGLAVQEQETFAARLRERYPTINIVNGGVVGFLSLQELSLAFFKLERLRPKLYIAFDGWNDAYDGALWYVSTGRPHPAQGVNSSFAVMQDRLVRLRKIETDPWQATVAATQSLSRRSRLIGLITDLTSHGDEQPSADGYPLEQLQVAIDTYVSNMQRLHTLATDRDGQLIVVLQPAADQLFDTSINPRKYGRYPKEIYARFRREAVARLEAAHIRVIDANQYLIDNGFETRDFIDVVHLSPSGHARIAEMLAAEMAPLVPRP